MSFTRIRDLREDLDLTQKEMGEFLKLSRRTYAHYENGTRNIPMDVLIDTADFHNVSVDYLLGRTNKKKVNR